MAVIVYSSDPRDLLSEIRAAIRDGKIETWKEDSDGDFTHSPDQWQFEAWFRPAVEQDKLTFNILGRKSKAMSKTVYAVYHGRFIEMLLTHFDLKFSRADATALPVARDSVRPK